MKRSLATVAALTVGFPAAIQWSSPSDIATTEALAICKAGLATNDMPTAASAVANLAAAQACGVAPPIGGVAACKMGAKCGMAVRRGSAQSTS